MRQNKEKVKPASTLRQKLLWYFLGFSAIILCVLWVTQTVFLDDFYRLIKTSRIEKIVEVVNDNIDAPDASEFFDELHEANDINIEVYDTSSDVAFYLIYTSRGQGDLGVEYMPHELFSYHNQTVEAGGEKLFEEEVIARDRYEKEHTTEHFQSEKKRLIYLTSVKISGEKDKETMVVVRSAITPVTSAVDTMRVLLMLMTVLVVLLSAGMAIAASWRFSKPLKDTTLKAQQLAKEDYDVSFDSRGYREVEELNSALSYAAEELGLASNLRKELIANVSHDLRTPLTMIKGYAEVMRDIPGEMNEANLQAIVDESTRLSQLVSDLLDISKLQSGAVPIEKKVFSITDCVADILIRFRGISEQQGYSLSFENSEEALVLADKARIEQVLYNLISNAVNYSGERKIINVIQTVTDNIVRIEVKDSGQGIEPEKLKNIWDRYYRADKNHRRSVVGTGLGLSIVKEILDKHEAHFGVVSTLGEGSTFWFELETVTGESESQDKI